SIDTKSDLILRDIDLLKEINSKNDVIIKFTITTPKDELSRIIEPNVCVSSKRLQAIKTLTDNGIFAGIMMNPVLPFITDKEKDIKQLIRLAYENGAKFINTYMGMTLRENQRDYYFNKLDQHFIGLKKEYIKSYGDRYNCIVLNAKNLYTVFTDECNKYGILYDMKDIIKAYKKEIKNDEQITMF
ncbi:MAG: radical SAM protein, partial [Clostridia bacterium]|nr:radical SAM protein [Clostridia bacterium]